MASMKAMAMAMVMTYDEGAYPICMIYLSAYRRSLDLPINTNVMATLLWSCLFVTRAVRVMAVTSSVE